MSLVDIILIVCFIPAFIQGLRRGLVGQLARLAAVIVGVWAAFRFSAPVSEWLAPKIDASESMIHALAFAFVLVVAMALLILIGKVIQTVIKVALLGWLDKLLGVIVSLATTALFLGALAVFFDTLNTHFGWVSETVLNESILFHPLENIVCQTFPFAKSLIAG